MKITREDAVFMLERLKEYIAITPIDQCKYCAGCMRTEDRVQCMQCLDDGLRALDLAIEKVKEKM